MNSNDLQVSTDDILMIIKGHAEQVQGALAMHQNLNTEALKRHIARMFAYADKLHEIAVASRPKGEENGAAAQAN
jgi:hypothetical protein